ncbi:MAG TPA: winged helix-turn-helix transcriptional regulator [bacterium]|nr:winged helix-turn-helix transcriptional regulator [bacterium]
MFREVLGPTKREIANQLNRENGLTLAVLAERLGISREAVRIQINEMIHDGWVARSTQLRRGGKAGRPATLYQLTPAGQHLFPKQYDKLAQLLLQVLFEVEGLDCEHQILSDLTEQRLAPWRERLAGLSLDEKLQALKELYAAGDRFTELERLDDGWRLVEFNCPFLNVALRYPSLCSTSVNLLTRLLGVRVVREERFQDGANRCTFRILPDQPCEPPGFELEPEPQRV